MLFLEEPVHELLTRMSIKQLLFQNTGRAYVIACTLKAPFEDVFLHHQYSESGYECDIIRGATSILTTEDKKYVSRIFSELDWLTLFNEIQNK